MAKMERKPEWLKVRLPSGDTYTRLSQIVKKYGLHTVCEEALCPNIGECWGGGTLTFMLLGDTCTRGCRFCAVKTGHPGGYVNIFEPMAIARAVKEMGLDYVVLTSVCRDDLPDGGADHFAKTVKAIKREDPRAIVEVLIPDFRGDEDALKKVVDAKPEVIAHNVETVKRLTPKVRDPRASYEQSLKVLENVKKMNSRIYTKSSIMLGLGETEEELINTFRDLRNVGVDILTLGQYLRPSMRHIEVVEYIHPSKFDRYRAIAEKMGFLYVAAGPLVRSSYKAGEFFLRNVLISQSH